MGWYTYAHGYDGFLRWAYDTWPADVTRDARNIHWNGGAGDCFMIYPGANSSIRFEKMREGIVDYEKLKILETQAAKSHDTAIKMAVRQLEEHLQTFNNERAFKKENLASDIEKGKMMMDELTDRLTGSKSK
jgi:hypothetical protein